jgi:hypothetical protein
MQGQSTCRFTLKKTVDRDDNFHVGNAAVHAEVNNSLYRFLWEKILNIRLLIYSQGKNSMNSTVLEQSATSSFEFMIPRKILHEM